MIILYGLKNCDGCTKARAWLTENDIDFSFHDLRAQPLTAEQVTHWLDVVGLDRLVNRRGTTYRKLSEDEKRQLEDPKTALPLLLDQVALMKRPIFERVTGDTASPPALDVGFSVEVQNKLIDGSR